MPPRIRRRLLVSCLGLLVASAAWPAIGSPASALGVPEVRVCSLAELQSALDEDEPLIRLCAGTFDVLEPLTADHSFTLLGAGPNRTFLDGGHTTGATGSQILVVTSPAGGTDPIVTLEGITFRDGYAPSNAEAGAVFVEGDLEVTECAFENNLADGSANAGAVSVWRYVTITDSTFVGNHAGYHAGAVFAGDSAFANRSYFFNNHPAQRGAAIFANQHVWLLNTTLYQNSGPYGVVDWAGEFHFYFTTIVDNQFQERLGYSSDTYQAVVIVGNEATGGGDMDCPLDQSDLSGITGADACEGDFADSVDLFTTGLPDRNGASNRVPTVALDGDSANPARDFVLCSAVSAAAPNAAGEPLDGIWTDEDFLVDARGVARSDGQCDAGAYEYVPAPKSSGTTTTPAPVAEASATLNRGVAADTGDSGTGLPIALGAAAVLTLVLVNSLRRR